MDRLVYYLLSAVAALIALTVHEYCHGYAAYKMGDETAKNFGRLTLNPLKHLDLYGTICMILFHFGWAKPVPINARNFKDPKKGFAITAAAGPIANLILGFISAFLYVLIFSLVKDITKNADGVYVDADGNEVDFSERIYIDIGLGMVNLTEGDIDTNSAYDTSFSGLECLGFGMSEFTYVNDDGVEVTETFPNNIYDIATEISKALENNETQYLERTLTMLKDEEVNIQTMQTELEGINDTEEIVKMNEYKYAWMLTLQFGGNLLPQSLMDFLK